MSDFCDLPKAVVRAAPTADVPALPSSRQDVLWDWRGQKLHAATEDMTFVELLALAVDRIAIDEYGYFIIDEYGNVVQSE